jgi:hypothetical protein
MLAKYSFFYNLIINQKIISYASCTLLTKNCIDEHLPTCNKVNHTQNLNTSTILIMTKTLLCSPSKCIKKTNKLSLYVTLQKTRVSLFRFRQKDAKRCENEAKRCENKL